MTHDQHVFKKLKQFGQAMSPDAIRQGLAASREALANGGRLSPEQLAAMTPEQRDAYEQAMADATAQAQRSADDAIARDRERRALLGPAGDLYGPMLDREQLLNVDIGAQIRQSWSGFGQALQDTVRSPAPPPHSAPPNSGDLGVQAAHERALRDEARTSYLAEGRSHVVITRIPADRKRPVDALAAWLGSSGLAARPDLVYGVSRVPDHLPTGLGVGKAALVEWDVVHAATTALPPAPPAQWVEFDARERWVARRPGEPSVLDEDLGVEFLRGAGLGPEHCLGVARRIAVDATGGDESTSARVLIGVTGVLALHPAGAADGLWQQMQAAAPLHTSPPADLQVTVLNWAAIRRAVAPRPDKLPPMPSPFGYLPLTAQELLTAHLEIVGIRPDDCYSAQVTMDQPGDIIGGTRHVTTTGADKEVAADGQLRKRFRGGSRVVVVYRDRAEYVAGRERWASYERDVLQSQLWVDTAVRAPLDRQSALDRGLLGAALRTAGAIDEFVNGYGWDSTDFDKIPHFRYCWPPVQ